VRKVIVTVLAALLLAGCAPAGDREQAVADVAERLLTAVEAGDGDAACALLAPRTVEDLESDDEPCARAVLEQDLPEPGAVSGTDVYGQWAQVRLAGDTVFLAAFPGGWRVVAAGCTPAGDAQPYDCAVQGG
jgi:hypothetical protein